MLPKEVTWVVAKSETRSFCFCQSNHHISYNYLIVNVFSSNVVICGRRDAFKSWMTPQLRWRLPGSSRYCRRQKRSWNSPFFMPQKIEKTRRHLNLVLYFICILAFKWRLSTMNYIYLINFKVTQGFFYFKLILKNNGIHCIIQSSG